jgi:predicted acyl esterase
MQLLADIFLPFGFVTVTQDMRGAAQSEGNFTLWHADADDSFDTGNWIVQQDWSNGVIYTFGASADGLAAFCTAYHSPEWLKAQYFIWASSVGYEVIYPNGAYLKDLGDIWITSTVPDSAEASLQELYEHEMFDDWWTTLEMTGQYSLVKWPSGFWAGWYDIFLVGNLLAYNGYNDQSNGVNGQSRITVDPLGHCQSAAGYFKPVRIRSLVWFVICCGNDLVLCRRT